MAQLRVPVTSLDHVLGDDNAPVTVVEYGDYECPHCGSAHAVVLAVRERMRSRLRFVFRHFPLAEIHLHAMHAAEAAEAAAEQGKFWEMYDALFENQEALEDPDLIRYAQALGLDAERVEREMAAIRLTPSRRQIRESGHLSIAPLYKGVLT